MDAGSRAGDRTRQPAAESVAGWRLTEYHCLHCRFDWYERADHPSRGQQCPSCDIGIGQAARELAIWGGYASPLTSRDAGDVAALRAELGRGGA